MIRRSALFANLLLAAPLAAGLLGMTPAASAQDQHKISHITIPFRFSAGGRQQAAGTYSVQMLSDYALLLRSNENSKATALMVRPEDGGSLGSQARLVFRRDERGTYLTQVWFAGSSGHAETTQRPKPSEEYAKQTATAPSYVEIAAK